MNQLLTYVSVEMMIDGRLLGVNCLISSRLVLVTSSSHRACPIDDSNVPNNSAFFNDGVRPAEATALAGSAKKSRNNITFATSAAPNAISLAGTSDST